MSSEYGEIIRLNQPQDHHQLRIDAYTYVAIDEHLQVRHYCANMTLARGRILYDVCDSQSHRSLAYLIPEDVLNEARTLRLGSVAFPWAGKPVEIRRRHQEVLNKVLEQFPRMPAASAHAVTLEIYGSIGRFGRLTKSVVEEFVIEHALQKWTSYAFRVLHMRQREKEAREAVMSRMRIVLRSWTQQYMSDEALAGILERRGLLDTSDVKDEDVRPICIALMGPGGGETVGTMRITPRGWT